MNRASRISPRLGLRSFVAMAAFLLAQGVPALADHITVTTSAGNGGLTVHITSGPKSSQIKVSIGNNEKTVDTGPDGSGMFTVDSAKDVTGFSYQTADGEKDFPGIVNTQKANKGHQITSNDEYHENVGNSLNDLNNLPFHSPTGVFVVPGSTFGQFQLVNTSTTTAYQISSVDIYTDLDRSFYDPTQFNSAAAIATGSLFYDSDAVGQLLTLNADNGSIIGGPYLTFPIGDIDPGGYVLLTGVASAINGDGSLGPPISFAVAEAVPEPGSLVLCGLGLAGAIGWRMRRRAEGAASLA